jgi:hypothetical protein
MYLKIYHLSCLPNLSRDLFTVVKGYTVLESSVRDGYLTNVEKENRISVDMAYAIVTADPRGQRNR